MKSYALITGASGGIGSAIAKALAEMGYSLILHYNSDEKSASALKAEIENQYPVDVKTIKADLSSPEQTKAFAQDAADCGEIGALVNNAGVAYQQLFQFADEEKVRSLFEINLMSAMAVTKEILPGMISRHKGVIINISSMWGLSGGSCEVHYSASKAALIGFTKALAKEVGPSGIRVNCVAPGYIDTKMNSAFDEDTVREIVEATPLMRTGKAEDVSSLVAFLVSDNASFITGQTVCVDGGLSS